MYLNRKYRFSYCLSVKNIALEVMADQYRCLESYSQVFGGGTVSNSQFELFRNTAVAGRPIEAQ